MAYSKHREKLNKEFPEFAKSLNLYLIAFLTSKEMFDENPNPSKERQELEEKSQELIYKALKELTK